MVAFCKHWLFRNHFVATPSFTPNWCLIRYLFWKDKNIDVEQKTQLKVRKTKTRKRDLKDKTRQETKETERIDENNTFQFNTFEVVLFMEQKQRYKAKKQRDKNKEAKSSKQRKQGRKKEENDKIEREREREREKEIDREREREKGGKTREKQREILKKKQKCPSLQRKQAFLCKHNKETKTKRKQNKRNPKQ